MKKIIITGGDNGFCCRCGGLCDRAVMEADTEHRELKYIDTQGVCLGKYCWRRYMCEDGTELVRDWNGKIHAYRNGVELPCVVKHNKWGKDGEFGNLGSSFWCDRSEYEAKRCHLRRMKRGLNFDDYLDDSGENKRDRYTEETGWALV